MMVVRSEAVGSSVLIITECWLLLWPVTMEFCGCGGSGGGGVYCGGGVIAVLNVSLMSMR